MSSNLNHALQLAHDWPIESFATPEQATPGVTENDDTSKSRFILNRLFQHFPVSFAVRLWNGSMLYIGKESPAFTLCLEQASVLRDMV